MRILLHVCCGPCALGPYLALKEKDVSLAGYWYNPNIHPYPEYQKRLMTAGFVSQALSLPLSVAEPDFTEFLSGLVSNHQEGNRCSFCWRRRLEKTAERAKAEGFDGFTTSLLASPHQDHQKIKTLGEEISQRQGIPFYYQDFRTYWKEAQKESRQMGLYHQNYCGCLYSQWLRFTPSRQ